MSADQRTADAFAASWNHLPAGSVYTHAQFEEWLAPLRRDDVAGRRVLELGCGNGSLMVHLQRWSPEFVEGVDLGDAVRSACANMGRLGRANWAVTRADMTEFRGAGYDVVYSIGVLHHLADPKRGLDAVIANTRRGGRFHCWVHAEEGNRLIIALVDPLRRLASRLPWWFTKYCLAAPLVVPYWFYAKGIQRLKPRPWLQRLPLYEYSLWIARREFAFFRHVAFDQLVAPRTAYIGRKTIQGWLASYPEVDPGSLYIVMRNGNSWKFGGRVR